MGALVGVLLLLAALLYFPPFQRWAVKQVAAYASEKTGMDITVEHVRLEFPLNLGVEGLRVLQQNDSLPQVKDTVADIIMNYVFFDYGEAKTQKIFSQKISVRILQQII